MKLIKALILTMFFIGGVAMAADYDQAQIYTDLRNQALSLTADQIDTEYSIIAVLMETGYPEAVATLVSVVDGSSSLYFSNGGGIIGAGEYKQVHDASIGFVSMASKNLNLLRASETHPLPRKGYTRFYVVTKSGIYSDEVLEDDLGNERHALSPLFFQGHELIYYIRAAEEHRSAEQGAPVDR